LCDASGDSKLIIQDSAFSDRITMDSDGNACFLGGIRVGAIGSIADDWIWADGGLYVNDSVNTKQTLGVTLNQGASNDEIFAAKSTSVTHPITDFAEEDTYGTLAKSEGTCGGLAVTGYKDADGAAGYALALTGRLGEAADTAKSAAAIGVVQIAAQVTDEGTGVANVGADGNLVVIANGTTARFIFDAEGSAHAEVEWTTFDDHDDMMLLTDFETAMVANRDPVKADFADFLQYNRGDLERIGIVHFDDTNPGHAMVNFTRLSMLLVGALRQMDAKIDRLALSN